MFSSRSTRRGLLAAGALGAALIPAAGGARADPDGRFAELARGVRALRAASARVDYDDPQAEAAYYAQAEAVIAGVIAAPARTIAHLQVKAEALVWCFGGLPAPPADAPVAERLTASILADLLAPAPDARREHP